MKKVFYLLFTVAVLSSCMDRGGDGNKDVPFEAPIEDPVEHFPVESDAEEVLKEEPDENIERAKENIKEYYDQREKPVTKQQEDFLERMSKQIEKQEKEDLPDSLISPAISDSTGATW